jgi:hypothetical protein
MLRQAAFKTDEGSRRDGMTTSTILGRAIFADGVRTIGGAADLTKVQAVSRRILAQRTEARRQ